MDGRAAYWTTVPARRTALQVGARVDNTTCITTLAKSIIII